MGATRRGAYTARVDAPAYMHCRRVPCGHGGPEPRVAYPSAASDGRRRRAARRAAAPRPRPPRARYPFKAAADRTESRIHRKHPATYAVGRCAAASAERRERAGRDRPRPAPAADAPCMPRRAHSGTIRCGRLAALDCVRRVHPAIQALGAGEHRADPRVAHHHRYIESRHVPGNARADPAVHRAGDLCHHRSIPHLSCADGGLCRVHTRARRRAPCSARGTWSF